MKTPLTQPPLKNFAPSDVTETLLPALPFIHQISLQLCSCVCAWGQGCRKDALLDTHVFNSGHLQVVGFREYCLSCQLWFYALVQLKLFFVLFLMEAFFISIMSEKALLSWEKLTEIICLP